MSETSALLQRYDAGWALRPDEAEPGLIYQACLALPYGVKVIAHFDSEHDARRFLAKDETVAALGEIDPAQLDVAVQPLHFYAFASDRVGR